jgi:adenosylcobinamide-GDP ribazoletransferase
VGAGDIPEPLRLLVVALRFMTRLPLPRVGFHEGDLRRASALFPLVGAVVAGIGIGVRVALEPLWGGSVATIGALAAMIVVTGALHEDGLADTADGLWGGWTPARRLEIMRDSRLGTYGIVALIVVLGLRASLLLPLGLADFARAVACGHVLGRASALLLVRLLPPAEAAPPGEAGGPGKAAPPGEVAAQAGASSFAGGEPIRPRLGAAVAGPLDLAGALGAGGVVVLTVVLATGPWAAVPLVAGVLTCLLCAELFRRRLGGITGDTLGAANQLVDLAAVAAVVALARAGLL